jgi:hypothetical protein
MENTIIYNVKCPRCFAKAEAIMKQPGICSGTYREGFYLPIARLITCNKCGFIKELSKANGTNYELWYKTKFKNHTLWAYNEAHIDFLINWLSKNMNKHNLEFFDRIKLEVLPKWLITNRLKVIDKLKKLKLK